MGDNNQPDSVAGSIFFARKFFGNYKTEVDDLLSVTPKSNVYSSHLGSSSNCNVLRNDMIRFEDACMDPVYRLYVSLVLLALMMVFCFFFLILLCYAFPSGEEERKP